MFLFPSVCDFRMSLKDFSHHLSFSSARTKSLLEGLSAAEAQSLLTRARSEMRQENAVSTVVINDNHFVGSGEGEPSAPKVFPFRIEGTLSSGVRVTRTVVGVFSWQTKVGQMSWYWIDEKGKLTVAAEPSQFSGINFVASPPEFLEGTGPVFHVAAMHSNLESNLLWAVDLSFSRMVPQLVPDKSEASGFRLVVSVEHDIRPKIDSGYRKDEPDFVSFFCERHPDGKGWIGRIGIKEPVPRNSRHSGHSLFGVEVFLPDAKAEKDPGGTNYLFVNLFAQHVVGVRYGPVEKTGGEDDLYWILSRTEASAMDTRLPRAYVLEARKKDTYYSYSPCRPRRAFAIEAGSLPGGKDSRVVGFAIDPAYEVPVLLVQGGENRVGWMVWLNKEGKVEHIADFNDVPFLADFAIITAEKAPGPDGPWAIEFFGSGGRKARVVVINPQTLRPSPEEEPYHQFFEMVRRTAPTSTSRLSEVPFSWARDVFLRQGKSGEVFLVVTSQSGGGVFSTKVPRAFFGDKTRSLGRWSAGDPGSKEMDSFPRVVVQRHSSGSSAMLDRPPGDLTGKLEINGAGSGAVVVDAPKGFVSSSQAYADTWAAFDPDNNRIGIFQIDITRKRARLIFGKLVGSEVVWDEKGWKSIPAPNGSLLMAGLVVLDGRFFILDYSGGGGNSYGEMVLADHVGKDAAEDGLVSPFSLETKETVILYGVKDGMSQAAVQEVFLWAQMNPQHLQVVIVWDDSAPEFFDELRKLPNVEFVHTNNFKNEENGRLLLYGKASKFSEPQLKWAEGSPVYVSNNDSAGAPQGFLSAVLLENRYADTPFARNRFGWKVLISLQKKAVEEWFLKLREANLAVSSSA